MAVVPGDGDTAGEQQHQRQRDAGSERRVGQAEPVVGHGGDVALDRRDGDRTLRRCGGLRVLRVRRAEVLARPGPAPWRTVPPCESGERRSVACRRPCSRPRLRTPARGASPVPTTPTRARPQPRAACCGSSMCGCFAWVPPWIGDRRVRSAEPTLPERGHDALTRPNAALTRPAGPPLVRSVETPMDYRVLGPLELQDGPRTVPLPQGRRRLLLAVLLAYANQTASSDRLIDALWGESPPPTAGAGLHNLVSAIRKDCRRTHWSRTATATCCGSRPGSSTPSASRRSRERARRRSPRGTPNTRPRGLREALQLWRGPPLADLAHHPSLAEEATRLEAARMLALEERIDADLARGGTPSDPRARGAHRRSTRSTSASARQQMLALYRAGRQADALAVYRDARERLVDELGIEPGPALRRLEQAMLAQDAELGAPDTLPRAPPARQWRAQVCRRAGRRRRALLVAAVFLCSPRRGGEGPGDRAGRGRRAAGDPRRDRPRHASRRARAGRRQPVGRRRSARARCGRSTPTGTRSRAWIFATRDVKTSPTGTIPLDIAGGRPSAGSSAAGSNLHSAAAAARCSRTRPRLGRPGAPRPPCRRARAALPRRRHSSSPSGAGGVWAIGRTGRLQRVDPRSGTWRRSVASPRCDVAAGDGQVWVLASPPPQRSRARPGPARPARPADRARPEAGRRLGADRGGRRRRLADRRVQRLVWRVDPAGPAPPRPIPVDQGIDSIAVGGDDVWTANSLAGTVARIDATRNAVRTSSTSMPPHGAWRSDRAGLGDGRRSGPERRGPDRCAQMRASTRSPRATADPC